MGHVNKVSNVFTLGHVAAMIKPKTEESDEV
jgi:hypothetical protein